MQKKGSKVAGAIWDITKEHEKILDTYEQFPDIYKKEYFYSDGTKIMFYIMKEYFIKDPPKSYIDVINEGYKDCNIDLKINYRFSNRRDGDVEKLIAETSKILKHINWKPKYNDLSEIINSSIKWEEKINGSNT